MHFLGRSGIRDICGLRVAYLSGVDTDMLGPEMRAADPAAEYLGHYFVQSDIQSVIQAHLQIVQQTGREGVDILMCG